MPAATPPLSAWTLIHRSLRFFWRTHLAVGLGIAAATAVIVGALVVGDSVRGSLRGLVVDRLANIECLLHARTFFDPQLLEAIEVNSLAAHSGHTGQVSLAPLILLSSSTAESNRDGQVLRASQVQMLAVDERFLQNLQADQSALFGTAMAEDEVVLNAALAKELNVGVGDEITLRLTEASGIPADNPLGRRDQTSISLPRQKVRAIVSDTGIGGIGFFSGQAVPHNVFASLPTVQDILDCESKTNAVLVFSTSPSQTAGSSGPNLCLELNRQLRPQIEDYGLRFERHRRVFPDAEIDGEAATAAAADANADIVGGDDAGRTPQVIYDYFQLSSEELIMDNATSTAVFSGVQADLPARLITYLANSITKFDRATSVSDVDDEQPMGDANWGQALAIPDSSSLHSSPSLAPPPFSAPAIVIRPSQPQTIIGREVPYSIIVGVDGTFQQELAQFSTTSPDIRFPYCWVNTWLAEQLDVKSGEWLQIRFYEPETADGREVEKWVQLFVAGVVPLTEPERPYRRTRAAQFASPPTLYNDPNLTPHVPGVTDQDSISNWDLPFKLELEGKILPVDDAYWNNHRLTPKIFLPYRQAASTQMFGSRFGQTTALRWPATERLDEQRLRSQIEEALLPTLSQHGLLFTPVRHAQLQAASGTTPFDMLFLSLSFFVIVAALLLVALLFKLGLQQRTQQIGTLMAQGFSDSHMRSVLLRELVLVAGAGATVGIVLGLAYARLMIAGLQTWWVGAISAPFLSFAFTWQSLLIGAVAGMLTSLLTIYVSLRRLRRAQPLAMLRGDDGETAYGQQKLKPAWLGAAVVIGFVAVGLVIAGLGQTGMARAGSFFGSGMLLLAAALIALWQWLGTGARFRNQPEHGNLWHLAWRAICRNPVRSALALGLLSVASFLIASMSVFQVSPSERGYGGFDLLAESSQPIFRNMASAADRAEMIGANAAEGLRGASIIAMRARRGEDASCNNLFQVSLPTILGLSLALQELNEFSPNSPQFDWTATIDPERPWAALAASASGEESNPIPVVLDQNTAAWSLKQGASLGALIKVNVEGQDLYFRTVGLLSNSVLQGKLLIDEENFERIFPKISGYSFFLIRSDRSPTPETANSVAAILEQGWGDVGLDVTSSVTVLERLLGVQNTYISAFQSLGALGLLLGTFGLVAVQIRSVVERRRELALMQAVGFSNARLAKLLTLETALLLGGGLCIGVLCAAVALVPFVIETGPQLSVFNPLLMLLAVLVAGFLAASLAVRAATRQSVLSGLRAE